MVIWGELWYCVAFSRDSATGENIFNGEYLVTGEDVVSGVRTPQQITTRFSKVGEALVFLNKIERRNTLH
jgi:pyruvate,orthophosphate dikinase